MEQLNLKLEKFEGPMDLLFHLIDKNEIDLYDIPISILTEQYLKYLDTLPKENMESMSEFIVMASTLLFIKSKMLLPVLKNSLDEEEIDPRLELVEKLIEYKRFKSVCEVFEIQHQQAQEIYFKKPDQLILEALDYSPKIEATDVLGEISIEILLKAFKETIGRKELKTDKVRSSFSSIQRDNFTIEEQQNFIIDKLKNSKIITFSEIFDNDCSKIEKIVTFLALLELIKKKTVNIIQESVYSEIELELSVKNK